MGKTKKCNQGFSLIELLIAVTILSIVMIMVVQFMSTTSAAYRKTKKNLNIQTEAMTVLEQMSDTIMQARYVRVVTKDQGMYTIVKTDGERAVKALKADPVTYDFVPDNYGNYAKSRDLNADDREVIINFDTYEIVNRSNEKYPISGDADSNAGSATPVRSFRALKSTWEEKTKDASGKEVVKSMLRYNYIKPEYIYTEHVVTNADGSDSIVHTLFYVTDITNDKEKTCSIYVYRKSVGVTDKKYNTLGMNAIKSLMEAELADKANGLLSDNVSDFYLSADVEGNALLTNILFSDGGYEYNTVETINFRNSNVLTVRPQKLYKVKGSGHNVNVPVLPPEKTEEENSGDGES